MAHKTAVIKIQVYTTGYTLLITVRQDHEGRKDIDWSRRHQPQSPLYRKQVGYPKLWLDLAQIYLFQCEEQQFLY